VLLPSSRRRGMLMAWPDCDEKEKPECAGRDKQSGLAFGGAICHGQPWGPQIPVSSFSEVEDGAVYNLAASPSGEGNFRLYNAVC
jgi:hypothetical protein